MSQDAPLFPLPGLDPPADQLEIDLTPPEVVILGGVRYVRDDPQQLTARQRAIAEMVADGLSNKHIARDLGISPSTVKNHVHAILTKLGLPRRAAIGKAITR